MSRFETKSNFANRVWQGAVCIFVVALNGCFGTNSDTMFKQATDSNAKRLGTLYAQYQISNPDDRLLGPPDKEKFVEFIQSRSSSGLSRIGVDKDNLDSLFVSERDQQPFKIRWEVQGISRGPAQPVIFESVGNNGKFVVGFTGFIQKEVDQSEYDHLWSGAADGEQPE